MRTRQAFLLAAFALSLSACSVSVLTDPQSADWGLGAIKHMQTPADPPLTCGTALPPDTLAAQRASCAFAKGDLPAQTLGISPATAASLPLRHVVILMKENRSFDHLLGNLHARGQPDADTAPASYFNPDPNGAQVFPFPATTTCYPWDPGHQSASVAASINNGKMDGFVVNAAATTSSDGHFVISSYDAPQLPFYYWLASTYALADRHFAPMASGTYGNRNFFLFGTNAAVVDTGISYPPPNTPSIMQLLMNAGFTWGVYADGAPFSGALDWEASSPGVHTLQELYTAMDTGTLPNVAFVDAAENVEDDHPPSDLQVGEAWTYAIYQHAVSSPQWDRMALLWTYDEAGGFADHVPPDVACADVPNSAFDLRGPRIPLVAVSPWAKRNFVSHVVRDHTSITRFIETLFGLPALSGRDANADALLDLFDFSCGRNLTVATAPSPASGGCVAP
jgi:phospholipase C